MTVNSSYPDMYPPAEVNGCTTKTTINDVQLKDNTQLSVVKQVNIKEFFSGNIKESFLNDFVSEFNFNTLKTFSFPNSENLYCSDDILINILTENSQFSSFQAVNNSKFIWICRELRDKYNPKFITFLQNRFPNKEIESAGYYVYPKNGYMGWHTNANRPCLRCYITYSENGDSYFKYRDPITKKIIIDNDNVGWKLRYFYISDKTDELLWHCVYSNTIRISMGYKIYL